MIDLTKGIPNWLRVGLIVTYSLVIVLGSSLVIVRNMPSATEIAEIPPSATMTSTSTPENTLTPMSTNVPASTPTSMNTNAEPGTFTWSGVDDIGDVYSFSLYAFSESENLEDAFDIVSAEARYDSSGRISVTIQFRDLPEYLDVGSEDNTETYIQDLWILGIDKDNDTQTGGSEYINTEGETQFFEGFESGLWLGLESSEVETVELATYAIWDFNDVFSYESDGSAFESGQKVVHEFDPEDNTLTMSAIVSDVVSDARLYFIVRHDGDNGHYEDYIVLQPNPVEEIPSAANRSTIWQFTHSTNKEIEPIIDLVSGEATLDDDQLGIAIFFRDVPKTFYNNRIPAFWELDIRDSTSDSSLEIILTNNISNQGLTWEWVDVSSGLKWVEIQIFSPDGYFQDFPSYGKGTAYFDTENNSLTFEITDTDFSENSYISVTSGLTSYDPVVENAVFEKLSN